MGKFRCISKPFKRFAYLHSKNIAEKGMITTYNKYKKKYIKKFKKESVPIQNLEKFKSELMEKLLVQKRLCHGKTREYWFLRGPRLFVTIFLGIICNIFLNQLLEDNPNLYTSISSGIIWLLISSYMLYQRLPDSILSSMMTTGHEHYTLYKRIYFNTNSDNNIYETPP